MSLNFNKIKFSLCKDLTIPEARNKLSQRCNRKNFAHPKDLATLCGSYVDDLELSAQLKWTTDEVLTWIKDLGFPQYQNSFKVNFIDGRKLLLLDAAALIKMNITDFEHVKKIAKEIREMYKIELERYDRSISLPSRNFETLFKFYKVPSGSIHQLCQRTKLLQKMKLMSEAKVQLNHFEKLHDWLQHIPELQQIRIGNIKRVNLFFVRPNPQQEPELEPMEFEPLWDATL